MLSTFTPFLIYITLIYIIILSFFLFYLKKTQFIFLKIWIMLLYLIIQALLIGYTGEDFYIILILSAEFPIFFTFFFFFATKTELGVILGESKGKNINIYLFLTFISILYTCFQIETTTTFNYYLPNDLNNTPQRSDFFLFYFFFFLLNPSIIIIIGILITIVTLIILLFTFQNQLLEMVEATTKTKVA